MAESTVTYGISNKGWTSFHSYLPDWMIGMNSNFYTFSGGNMWKHYSKNIRNNYYDLPTPTTSYPSRITPVFNDDPTANKMFKTISLESNAAWKTTVTTDQSSGFMEASYYQLKEGDYYAYIRRVAGNTDLDLMSAQGIGNILTVTGASPGAITLTFNFDIGSIVSIGDQLYRDNSGIELIGTITGLTTNSITMNTTSVTPVIGDYVLYIKDAQVESYGARGYFMETLLENDSTSEVELFAVFSEVFKSFP
tara:strand:- start:21651 stop:22403 length:753 start_codon:yes stop_codon:yes gene_type:complete